MSRLRLVKFAPKKRRMRKDSLEVLSKLLREARRGYITGFVYAAVGPDFATWYGWPGSFTRNERITMLGQLEMIKAAIVKAEEEG